MATRPIVPRANGEGSLGVDTAGSPKYWGDVFTNRLNGADAKAMASRSAATLRAPYTNYSSGAKCVAAGLPANFLLVCTIGGTTANADITLPATIADTVTFTDGSVTWQIQEIVTTSTFAFRQPSTSYDARSIVYCTGLPTGWYLECTTAGTTDSGAITLPSPIVENDTFTDGTVTWAIRKINSSVYVPDYERQYPIEVAGDSASDRNVLVLPPMTLNLNGVAYTLPVETEIDADDSDSWDSSTYATKANRKGLDFYIFACISSTGIIPVILLSANSTVPTGYNANTSRKIGGFHCECANIGTISGHPLSGYEAGDILPASVWDLKHRAASENEGMVYCAGINKWVDIYLGSWDGSELVSAFGGVIADGTSSPAWHGELFAESMGEIGKSLLWRDEFMCVAKGSNELTNISTSADPNTTGGHTDTGGRRMVSKYGLEDCCGVLWQWGRDMFENWPGSTHNNDNQWLDGYNWSELSVYGTGDSAHYGSCFGFLRRVLLGGHWSDGSYCGSRSALCYNFSAHGGHAIVGVRGASEPRSAGA